jgi:hypothetical protein
LKQIDKLIDMKLNEDVTDEEYQSKRKSLLNDKNQIELKLNETKSRADNWLEIVEKAFGFVTNLRQTFNQGDSKIKANILLSLGKSITILNGKLAIEPCDWLLPIKESYAELEAKYLRLKLPKNTDLSLENDVLVPIRKTWLGRVSKVRTCITSLHLNEVYISSIISV